MKEPNTICSNCKKDIYRKPNELKKSKNSFCSKECMWEFRGKLPHVNCKNCGKKFKQEKRSNKYCSRSCSNHGRRGITYSKLAQGNKSQRRLALLKNVFNFKNCMVKECTYNKTFDIHRLEPGKDGGKYEIGNMFAICPNHHAEVTRGIILLHKINDHELKYENRK